MARQRLSAEERRRQLLKCASRIFARHTFHGATTRMIAEEAGVAEALIFRYFGSKRQLFCEAVSLSGARLVDGLDRCLGAHPDDPADALRALLLYYLDTLARHPELARMIFLVSAELDDPLVREAYIPHQERALHLLAAAVRRWQELRRVRPDPSPRAAAWLILGGYQILALMKHSGRLEEVDVDLAINLLQPYLAPVFAPDPQSAQGEAT